MKRKVLSVMLATAMTATLFAGCGSDASNADSANSADATAITHRSRCYIKLSQEQEKNFVL